MAMAVPGIGGLELGAPGLGGASPANPVSFFTTGYPMGKLTLQLLTIFPPTGLLGINLSAAGMPLAALAKGAVFGVGAILAVLVNAFYAPFAAKAFTYLMFLLPPWYLFDIIQICLDDSFNYNGFQPPLPIKEVQNMMGGGKGGTWYLTPSSISLILGATGAAGLGIAAQLVPGGLGPITQYAAIGGGSLLGIGGIAGALMSKPAASAPGPPIQGGGGRLPPLSSFAKDLTKTVETNSDSIAFLGILGIVVFGGLSLSLTR